MFEELMVKVLRRYGYEISSHTANTNHAGMEIDIEGKHSPMNAPLYAECKCYENEIDSPKLQAFFGKYMTRWLQNKLSHGLFIALPGLNSHAKGFYQENCKDKPDFMLRLFEPVLECTAATLRGKKSKIGEVLCEVLW